jgi:hypothetical protein
MLVKVNEVVEVIAIFRKNKVLPVMLKWNNRTYKITKMDMVHQTFDGNIRMHHFSVSDHINFFKLVLDTKSLKWILEEVYHEG